MSSFAIKLAGALILGLLFSVPPAFAVTMDNGTVQLDLETDEAGVPVIAGGTWDQSGASIFTDAGINGGFGAWLPAPLASQAAGQPAPSWTVTEDSKSFLGMATIGLPSGVSISWVVELPKRGSMFLAHVAMGNAGQKPQQIAWFPAWTASWSLPDRPDWLRWWDAMTYQPHEQSLAKKARITLGSQLSSSNDNGANPYWILDGKSGRLCFGLAWSGGWSAQIKSAGSALNFSAWLPADQTQLTLNPGDQLDGPELLITALGVHSDKSDRRIWMVQRQALAQALYGGPPPSFPLTYDHWYAAKTDPTPDFLSRQIAAIPTYGFDAFIIDAGWFDSIGSWNPDPNKFAPGQFEGLMKQIANSGAKVGIWSAPQYVAVSGKSVPATVDNPAYINTFLDAYLLDLWGSGYDTSLSSHVQMLRQRYLASWWKYDQPFFAPQSRAGLMKNVIAFQEGLTAVRAANPDLTIENCDDGGHMINEVTLLATQTSWLLDQPRNDLDHMRTNIQVSLDALEFIFPWADYRWTNRPDELGDGEELLKFYCRSAMAGVWGISADLSLLDDTQRSVIQSEIKNYRQVSGLKADCLYDLQQPQSGLNTAWVEFYGRERQNAAAIVYRWDATGPFNQQMVFKGLNPKLSYAVTDADTGSQTTASGSDLANTGVKIQFSSTRMSAIVYVSPAAGSGSGKPGRGQ